MKTIHKFSVIALVFSFAFFMFGLTKPNITRAATTPSLGLAATYGVLGSTYTNTAAGTTITGDVGFTTGPAVAPLGVHTNYGSGAPYATAGTDQGSALSVLASQACTFTFAPGAIDLATDTTHGTAGIYSPGVYCTTGAASIGTGGITLNGNGTYIFRINGALTTVANSVVTLNGASACDVFWTPTSATTLGANSTFAGTNIDASGITIGSTVTWTGRALAFGGTVTTNTDTITVPTCAVLPPPATTATLHVVKQVVNNNGGTATPSLFNLHVKLAGTDVSGSPAVGIVAPGTSYVLSAGTYVVSEDANASYSSSFSGACNASGSVTLVAGDNVTCTITNDDIAVPSALATLHVIKRVINDNGGTASASSFTMHVKNLGFFGTDVAGSPASGTVAPGTSYSLPAGIYVVSENANNSYTQSFSGDCDANGNVTLSAGADRTCTITNNDIAVAAAAPAAVVPVLPNTGVGPEYNNSTPWNIIIPSGIFVVLASLYVARKKQLI
jgi:hypothetical protein